MLGMTQARGWGVVLDQQPDCNAATKHTEPTATLWTMSVNDCLSWSFETPSKPPTHPTYTIQPGAWRNRCTASTPADRRLRFTFSTRMKRLHRAPIKCLMLETIASWMCLFSMHVHTVQLSRPHGHVNNNINGAGARCTPLRPYPACNNMCTPIDAFKARVL